MKKFLILLIIGVAVAIHGAGSAYAARTARLMDKTYQAPDCLVLCADPSQCRDRLCRDIDPFTPGFEKFFTEELDVYPSGEIAVYVEWNKGGGQLYGGINPHNDIFFYPQDRSAPIPIGDGLQVFQPGKIRISFTQPYDNLYRREMNVRVIVYFYAHTEDDLERFRQIRVRDLREYESYIQARKDSVTNICNELRTSSLKPNACLTPAERRTQTLRTQMESFNQSELNLRKPVAQLDRDRIYTFTHQTNTIRLISLEDPDGQCHWFNYHWDEVTGKHLPIAVNDMGDAIFRSEIPGDYMVRFRLQENCPGHSRFSDPIFIPVKVTDRTTLFPDLPTRHPYYEYILDLYSLGVMQGYPDGTVRPNKLVGRAEFLKMLFETAHVIVPESAFSYAFPDVRDGEWYSKYVFFAKNLGIIDGYPDNYFRPTGPVNLAEALKMMLQITDIELKESLYVWFGDVDISDWFSRYILAAHREGIIQVQPQQNVKPGRLLTRGEVAELLVRTFIRPVNRLNMVNVNKLRYR